MLNKFKKFRRENGKHSETLIPFLINTCVICLKILFELKNNVYKSITNWQKFLFFDCINIYKLKCVCIAIVIFPSDQTIVLPFFIILKEILHDRKH